MTDTSRGPVKPRYRGGTCPHGIFLDTRCFNCEPEPSATEPSTEAGRALLNRWRANPKELWTVDEVAAAIRAIENERG